MTRGLNLHLTLNPNLLLTSMSENREQAPILQSIFDCLLQEGSFAEKETPGRQRIH